MDQTHVSNEPVPLLRSVLIFCGSLIALQIILMLISGLLQFDLPSAMGVIVAVFATQASMMDFVKQYARAPTTGERLRFATGAAIASVFVTMLIIGLFSIRTGNTELDVLLSEAKAGGIPSIVVFGGIALVATVVTWLVAYFASGLLARNALKAAAKQAQDK
jgi:hypothetical protein